MISKAFFSSKTDLWATPQWLFDKLNEEFQFTLDPCATQDNAKCKLFFTKDDDGLRQSWKGHKVFCNPPYGRELPHWVQKAYAESCQPDTIVVLLIPARTDTRWFHEYIYGRAKEIRFLKGRLKFGAATNSAPFPSMVVVFADKLSARKGV